MGRFDLLNGKKPPKLRGSEIPDNIEIEGIRSQQTAPSRTMLIRGPNGYSLIIPVRSLRSQLMDIEDTDESIVQLWLPKKQARALVSDINTATRLRQSEASGAGLTDSIEEPESSVISRRSRPSEYDL